MKRMHCANCGNPYSGFTTSDPETHEFQDELIGSWECVYTCAFCGSRLILTVESTVWLDEDEWREMIEVVGSQFVVK